MSELPPEYRNISETLQNHLRKSTQTAEASCTQIGVPRFHAKALLVSRLGGTAAMEAVMAEVSEGEFVSLMRHAFREASAIRAHGS